MFEEVAVRHLAVQDVPSDVRVLELVGVEPPSGGEEQPRAKVEDRHGERHDHQQPRVKGLHTVDCLALGDELLIDASELSEAHPRVERCGHTPLSEIARIAHAHPGRSRGPRPPRPGDADRRLESRYPRRRRSRERSRRRRRRREDATPWPRRRCCRTSRIRSCSRRCPGCEETAGWARGARAIAGACQGPTPRSGARWLRGMPRLPEPRRRR